jgi:hypothetical protein
MFDAMRAAGDAVELAVHLQALPSGGLKGSQPNSSTLALALVLNF